MLPSGGLSAKPFARTLDLPSAVQPIPTARSDKPKTEVDCQQSSAVLARRPGNLSGISPTLSQYPSRPSLVRAEPFSFVGIITHRFRIQPRMGLPEVGLPSHHSFNNFSR